MSISNHDIIDAVAANENKLILLISDHLRWDNYQVAHLKMLQDKLNTYIRYIEQGGYKERFPDKSFSEYIIEIQFLHQYDEGFARMVALAKPKLDKKNITIVYEAAKSPSDTQE